MNDLEKFKVFFEEMNVKCSEDKDYRYYGENSIALDVDGYFYFVFDEETKNLRSYSAYPN